MEPVKYPPQHSTQTNLSELEMGNPPLPVEEVRTSAVSRCLAGVLESAADEDMFGVRNLHKALDKIEYNNKLNSEFLIWFSNFMRQREAKGVETYGHTMDKARIEDLEDGVEEEIGDALMYAEKEADRAFKQGRVSLACEWRNDVIDPLLKVMHTVWVLRQRG